jgi:hypothetical protein
LQLQKGLSLDELWRTLTRRYDLPVDFSCREKWYGLRCLGDSVREVESFLVEWRAAKLSLPDVSEQEAKQCLLKALPPKLQQHLLHRQSKEEGGTLNLKRMEDEVMRKARNEEQLRSLQRQLAQPVDVAAVGWKPSSGRKCFTCGDVGHGFLSCPKGQGRAPQGQQQGRHQQQQQQQQQRHQSPKRSHSQPHSRGCYVCNKVGHLARDCPDRVQSGSSGSKATPKPALKRSRQPSASRKE